MVAFGENKTVALLCATGPKLESLDAEDAGLWEMVLDAEDVEGVPGVWVWEGAPEDRGHNDEWSPHFNPEGWRRPTNYEWERLQAGQRPWPAEGAYTKIPVLW